MPKAVPPPLGLTLTILRMSQGWTQEELAALAGTSSGIVSDYEVGRNKKTLTREKLDRFAEILGFSPSTVDDVLAVVRPLRPVTAVPFGLSLEDLREVERGAATVGQVAAEAASSDLIQALRDQRASEARLEAGELWERLRNFSPSDRLVLVDGEEYQKWALCERLCFESERAAASDVTRAVELAELALRVAERVPGVEGWRLHLQGYAWAHIGNARRVSSDLPGADAAFSRARELWETGDGDSGPLARAQVLHLEASLRRAQRRFGESLDLLERALAVAPPGLAGVIVQKVAATLQQMGDHARAVETLQEAARQVDRRSEPRLYFALRFNLAANLGHLGRHEEAAELLPEVREMAVQLRNELDLIRVRWLEGRVAAGQGRRAEAAEALTQVRAEFAARGIGYDAALASLEMAVLYLEEGQTAEVKALAREMAPIFQAQGVHREALVALRLFCDAAEREAATLEMARRLVQYLERARLDPELRFAASWGATP
jgi:transcriptional regulator with XRE-family HTH domain